MMDLMFKAWDRKNHKMYTHIEYLDGRNCMGSFSDFLCSLYDVVMYTGVDDCNGSNIYELDVLMDREGTRWIVRWDKDNARFYIDDGNGTHRLDWGVNRKNYTLLGSSLERPSLI